MESSLRAFSVSVVRGALQEPRIVRSDGRWRAAHGRVSSHKICMLLAVFDLARGVLVIQH